MGLALLAATILAGCALQGGAHAGHSWNSKAGFPDQWTWGGHAQVQHDHVFHDTRLRLHVGMELEGRGEEHLGSLLTWGGQVGPGVELGRAVTVLTHVDLGRPIGWANPVGGHYFGFGLELPILTDDPGSASQVNRDLRFVDSLGAFVPYVRLRVFELEVSGADQGVVYEGVVGFAFRTTLVTDLL